ncbi:YceI family protein [Campylobacter sp. CCUG 57310]|uniref:YceI family protein n=1 Tax=Campylobacter sp. CCUG 57310 TaxID=2517362 RepID=UPI0015648B7E|nr:YceI family protein [Campylobacter sp. CCUG 57310]QKF93022.1 YceI-like domain-containing periplasmic protein [Campylobacter sp. CCUG 57310]
MKKLIKISAIAALLASFSYAQNYAIDHAHSTLGFQVKHLKIAKVNGKFKAYDAKVDYDKATNELKMLEVTIDTKSIDTDNKKRDEHLSSEDFFDAGKFDKITFKMTKFEKEGSDEGNIYGDLTIRGVTKPVKLDFEYGGDTKDHHGNEKIGFSITGEVMRKDFNVGSNFGDAMISEKVKIQVNVEAAAK